MDEPTKIPYPFVQVAQGPKEHNGSDEYDEERELDLRASAPHVHLPTRNHTLSALDIGDNMDRAGSMLLGGRHMHRDCRMHTILRLGISVHRAARRVTGEYHMHRAARSMVFQNHAPFALCAP